jgi:hypothetical protein
MILPQIIIQDTRMTRKVERTWKERLFTCPWKPWQRFRYEPDPLIYSFQGKLVMHPKTAQRLLETVGVQNPKP